MLCIAKILAIAMLAHESGVHLTSVVQQELLEGHALTRPGVPDLMESSKKWEPSKGVVAGLAVRCCSFIYKPLG